MSASLSKVFLHCCQQGLASSSPAYLNLDESFERSLSRHLYNMLILSKSVQFDDLNALISSTSCSQLQFGISSAFEKKFARVEWSALNFWK